MLFKAPEYNLSEFVTYFQIFEMNKRILKPEVKNYRREYLSTYIKSHINRNKRPNSAIYHFSQNKRIFMNS